MIWFLTINGLALCWIGMVLGGFGVLEGVFGTGGWKMALLGYAIFSASLTGWGLLGP